MGTNYYAVRSRPTVETPIHIGKSSAGCRFLFQGYKGGWLRRTMWQTYEDVTRWLKEHTESGEYVILDEYDRQISYDDFIKLVEEKQKEKRTPAEWGVFHWGEYEFEENEFS